MMRESAALRLERARSALALAEQQAGVASARLRVVGAGQSGTAGQSGAPAERPGESADAWTVPGSLSSLFPRGLVKGMTLSVEGSRLASLVLASIPSSQGAWTACMGMADMGWLCASRLGMDLEKTVAVPACKAAAMGQALAAAVDGFDVVLVGGDVRLEARERRLLARRALARGVVLIGEGWAERCAVHARYLGASGMRSGSGHVADVAIEMAVAGSRPVRIGVGASGWEAGGMLEAVRP